MLSSEELYRFDVAGFFVRPDVLTAEQVTRIAEQIRTNPHSAPGGTASILIDYPAVVGTVGELIGAVPRIEDVEVFRDIPDRPRLGGTRLDTPRCDLDIFDYRLVHGARRRKPGRREARWSCNALWLVAAAGLIGFTGNELVAR